MTTPKNTDDLHDMSEQQKRALLAALLHKARDTPILSITQERIWQLDQIVPGNPVYNFQSAIVLSGQLDHLALNKALDLVVERHETLRTSYGSSQGKPHLNVLRENNAVIEHLDWRNYNEEQKNSSLQAAAQTRFDLNKPPLFRLQCCMLADETFLLVLTMHHIVSDLLSLDIFLNELGNYYGIIVNDSDQRLPAITWSYQDYARSESTSQSKLSSSPLAEFWREYLVNVPQLRWIGDFPRPTKSTGKAATYHLHIDSETLAAIEALARAQRVTPFVVLLSAYFILQQAISASDRQMTTVPTAGRSSELLQTLIGMFSTPLPIRADLSGNPSFVELLQRVSQSVLDVTEHSSLPFSNIVDIANEINGEPLALRSMFSFVSRMKELQFAGLSVERLPTDRGVSDFDIFLTIYKDGDGWRGVFEYNTDLFSSTTAKRWADGYGDILRAIITGPTKPISELSHLIPLPTNLQIAVAATFTADMLEESVDFWQHQLHYPARINFAPYNQIFQALMDRSSVLYQNNTLNVLLLRPEDWVRYTDDSVARRTTMSSVAEELVTTLRQTKLHIPTLIYICPSTPGSIEHDAIVNAENYIESALNGVAGITVLRTDNVIERYGVDSVHDNKADGIGHIPFSRAWFVAVATELMRRASCMRRPPVKVIALDCDNTLWRGVVGEDGPQGIYIDKPFHAFQQFLSQQVASGRLLCLVSKNEQEDVFRVFDVNNDVVLKREQIVAHRINWQPKSENLRALARELKLGLDSFVFIDDNPVECAGVQAACPEVLTLCLPQDLDAIPYWLDHIWAFDSNHSASAEDRKRTESYLQNQKRRALRQEHASLSDFLSKLQLQIDIVPADHNTTARLVQLSQRTNQFNNAGVRYDEQSLDFAQRNGLRLLAVSVSDRFGDYGLVGMIGYHLEERIVRVSSFLLSCRVLGRGVEHHMLAELGRIAIMQEAREIHFDYKKLSRNGPFLYFLTGVDGKFSTDGNTFILSAESAAEACFKPDDYENAADNEESAVTINSVDLDTISVRQKALEAIANDLRSVDEIMARLDKEAQRNRRAGMAGGKPPQGEAEMTIADIWRELLRIDAVGRDDNFFEIGGNSLLLVQVNGRLIERFGRDISITTLFQFPTISSLAKHLGGDSMPDLSQVHTRATQARKQLANRMERLGKLRREGTIVQG